ncbi:MAG: hypothetical protein DPW16_08375 [Chloroflexi bacterium]|nr:hypothetical protein [Chloroflexota bacterium]
MNPTQNPKDDHSYHYTPSSQMAEKLTMNRQGKMTRLQRSPIVIAALVSSIGFICPATMLATGIGLILRGPSGGILSYFFYFMMFLSFFFLAGVLWTNASMFLPETFSKKPVRWQRGPLEIKMASRNRPEMPFSFIIGSYSFAPFVVPSEVPMNTGREYIVYYSARSRLLLSIAPTDQPESKNWLPLKS